MATEGGVYIGVHQRCKITHFVRSRHRRSTMHSINNNPSNNVRDSRYDILFESVGIGPLLAKNRFYQVPHCNGGGYRDPSAAAEMRGIKAEGG